MKESKLFEEISNLKTEKNNIRTQNMDMMSTSEILTTINNEDSLVATAVKSEIPNIAQAVDGIVSAFKSNGRLFYIGAGTSGRLGIVDASECPPTFGSDPEMIQGIIAGGDKAVFRSQEGAEDSFENGQKEILLRNIKYPDVVCGIAASGRTPFVHGALIEANKMGCFTILVSTGDRNMIESYNLNCNVIISPDVGPEIIAGSTRMKSGTAQKLVLNMLTTASMVLIGKTLGNVMVDLQLTNAKLIERAKKTIMTITDLDYSQSSQLLKSANGNVKTALIMHFAGIEFEKAKELLDESDGFVRIAIEKAIGGKFIPNFK